MKQLIIIICVLLSSCIYNPSAMAELEQALEELMVANQGLLDSVEGLVDASAEQAASYEGLIEVMFRLGYVQGYCKGRLGTEYTDALVEIAWGKAREGLVWSE